MSSSMLTLPALGRPFQPGMLYDCRTDQLIHGTSPWKKEELEAILHHEDKTYTNCSIIISDSLQDKADALGINSELKLSVLVGLANLNGASQFLQDHKNNSQTSRVTLKYHTINRIKSLNMDHLRHSDFSQVFENGTATHICTGVEYGADLFLVFDKNSQNESTNRQTYAELESAVKMLKSSIEGIGKADVENSIAENISCKAIGDVSLDKNPTNYKEAGKIITYLPQLIKLESIPKIVHLYSLENLDSRAAKLVTHISESIISKTQDTIQGYINLMADGASLLQKPIVREISFLRDDVNLLIRTAELALSTFKQDILPALPEIRGGKQQESSLSDIVNKWLDSSFSPLELLGCLKVVKGNSSILYQYSKQALETQIPIHFNDSINDFAGIEVVLAFKFNENAFVSGKLDEARSKLQNMNFAHSVVSKEVSAKPESRKILHDLFAVFIHYFEQSTTESQIKYAISNGVECPDDNLAFIELYEYGSSEIVYLPAKPHTPSCDAESTTTTTIDVSWKAADVGKDYILQYKLIIFEEGSIHDTRAFESFETTTTIKNLHPGKKYYLQVQAVSKFGYSTPSDTSKEIMTQFEERLALLMLRHSEPIRDTNKSINIYSPIYLQAKNINRNTPNFKRICIGTPPKGRQQTDVTLMVVGATGTGKTTFLNSMLNYAYDVRQEDDFRFKIISQDDETTELAKSKTKTVTAYTMYQTKLRDVRGEPCTLTVVDTPGYGDTEGLAADRQTTQLIKELFESQPPNGISFLNAVCLVVKSSDSRLNAHQQHNFISVLQLFGKDLAKNFVIVATFCDAAEPPVKETLEAANITFRKLFKFNNSVFFEGQKKDEFARMFWDMGQNSFDDFFNELIVMSPVSLQQSATVLSRRYFLQQLVIQFHQNIQLGLGHLDTMCQEGMIMEKYEAQVIANEQFTFTTTEPQVYTEKISHAGQNTTTCFTCNSTCHESCIYADDSEKMQCCAMEGLYCKVCPGKCKWDLHRNAPYVYRIRHVTKTKTNAELKQKYGDAQANMLTKENMMEKLAKLFGEQQMEINKIVGQINAALNELKEIAHEPSFMTDVEYIDILIEEEKMKHSPGWQQRVGALQEQRNIAVQIKQAQNPNFDPFEKYKKSNGGWRKYAKKIFNILGF